jgi:SAM-dependent methyltransferase
MEEYDVFGSAIADYYQGKKTAKITVYSEGFDKQYIKCSQLFRTKENLANLELEALRHCRGKVLDIGAGAGCHAMILQKEGLDVTALEVSKEASEIMVKQGIQKVVTSDILHYKDDKFDTLLLLMNGIGIAGTIKGLIKFLKHLKKLLKPGGIILAESSDLLFSAGEEEIDLALNAEEYYGEVDYLLEYKGKYGKPFKWLFIDLATLKSVASKCGFETQLLFQDFEGGYLVKLSIGKNIKAQTP